MKKSQKALVALIPMLLSACTNDVSSSSVPAPSSPVSSSEVESTVSSSSSEAPKVKEAPTIDKVAAALENCLEIGLSSYTYSNRDMNKNYRFGGYNKNMYYTIEAKQYTNGSDSIKTEYVADSDDLTFDRVYGSGPLRTYKLDDNYYVYGYVSDRVNMDQNNDFVEVLERNRYNDETTMEYWTNGLGAVFDAFDGTSFWPESSGYELEDFSVELEEDFYYCEIGATAPENDRYPEEDNHAWVKMDAYTYEVKEVGIYMQAMCPSTSDYAGEVMKITQVVLSDMVCAPLVEGEIEQFDLEKIPSYLVNDYRASAPDVAEGDIDPEVASKIIDNLRCYTNGTNYSHRDFVEEVGHYDFDLKQYVVDYYAKCYSDAYAVVDESLTIYTYKDDNDPATSPVLQQINNNVATDSGIRCEYIFPVATEYSPEYMVSSYIPAAEVYSLNDYLNPNSYFLGNASMVYNEVATYGWGKHSNSYSNFEYELVQATNVNGVIDIKWNIKYYNDDGSEARPTDEYVIQITNGFLNMTARKTNGAADFDTWHNYKIEPMNY